MPPVELRDAASVSIRYASPGACEVDGPANATWFRSADGGGAMDVSTDGTIDVLWSDTTAWFRSSTVTGDPSGRDTWIEVGRSFDDDGRKFATLTRMASLAIQVLQPEPVRPPLEVVQEAVDLAGDDDRAASADDSETLTWTTDPGGAVIEAVWSGDSVVAGTQVTIEVRRVEPSIDAPFVLEGEIVPILAWDAFDLLATSPALDSACDLALQGDGLLACVQRSTASQTVADWIDERRDSDLGVHSIELLLGECAP